ncbi:hypothetical protein ERUR111494_05345 [Erysipelothrix urinaevulpis]|uniref:hypothetical protein n=1 Tax=Erysipelothrix urinaevulpis TaxID=2683717 RepID=UPI00135B36FF|nr:hypothetical protein [Erysipelothrix urinaevulpis]
MKKEDLIEFLRSTIESDAIVSRLYRLFHVEYGYSLNDLSEIIIYGVNNNYFSLENVDDEQIKYNKIDWRIDNIEQEVIMNEPEKYIGLLFGNNVEIPKEFLMFLQKIDN